MNTDRHIRNYGIIRSSVTGEIIRMAPNFDNNQAYLSNLGGHYSDGMLFSFKTMYGLRDEDSYDLQTLLVECQKKPFLKAVCEVGNSILPGKI